MDQNCNNVNKCAIHSEPSSSKTLMILDGESGSKVYVIGTAHFSKKSIEEVQDVIRSVQPDFVVVELCMSRLPIMVLDEKRMLEEAGSLSKEKMQAIIRESGFSRGSVQILMLYTVAKITRELGTAPGGEFRMAFKEAQMIPGCMTILGDRPVDITFQRAVSTLSFWQRLKLSLASMMPARKQEITAATIEELKERNIYDDEYYRFEKKYPGFTKALIDERDMFLTYSLQTATRMKERAKVVGVVGVAHMPGIRRYWGTVTKEDIQSILKVPPGSRAIQVVNIGVKAAMLGAVVFGIHHLFFKKKQND